MHSAFVSIVAQQQLLSQSGRHCRFEIAVAILVEIAAAITPQTSLSSWLFLGEYLPSDFEFGGLARCHKLQKGQSKTFCMLLQWIMGRISSNKNADIYTCTDSFLLDLDSSEGMKGWGKGRRNLILYHYDQVFTILKILVSEKSDKFSFELRWILKQSVFSAMMCDWTLGWNGTVVFNCKKVVWW